VQRGRTKRQCSRMQTLRRQVASADVELASFARLAAVRTEDFAPLACPHHPLDCPTCGKSCRSSQIKPCRLYTGEPLHSQGRWSPAGCRRPLRARAAAGPLGARACARVPQIGFFAPTAQVRAGEASCLGRSYRAELRPSHEHVRCASVRSVVSEIESRLLQRKAKVLVQPKSDAEVES